MKIFAKQQFIYSLLAGLLAWPGLAVHAQDSEDALEEERVGSVASADSQGGGGSNLLEEVMVTATKRATNLMETPIAVSAFSQDALNREGVQNVTDLSALVPGLEVGVSPTDSGVQIAIRGISSNNFTEIGDPTVGIHVDGMYSPRPQGGLALLHDVERIEILRGPQGTLFGRNSTAGSINIITARPEFDGYSGSVQVEYGNFNHRLLRGHFNFPFNDTLGFRLSYMADKTDSWIDQDVDMFDLQFTGLKWADLSVKDDDGNDVLFDLPPNGIPNVDQRRNHPVSESDSYFNSDKWAVRLGMLWTPTDRISWLLSYDYFLDNSAGSLSLKDCEKARGTFFACESGQWEDIPVNVPGSLDMTIATWRSEFIWDFSDTMVVESRLAIGEQQRAQVHDGTVAYADPDHPAYGIARECCGGQVFPNLVRDPQRLMDLGFPDALQAAFDDLQLTTRESDYDSIVHELQFKSTGDSPLQWIAGHFYMKEENSIIFDVEIPFCCGHPRPLAQTFVQPERSVRSRAFFTQFDYAATERLNLTAGYRHTWDSKRDVGGSSHVTTGYWTNPNLYEDPDDPNGFFWHESYAIIGNPFGDPDYPAILDFYEADDLLPTDGTLGGSLFTERVPGTDNSYSADWEQGTWKLGFDYLISDTWFVYGYAATGFKAGGFGDVLDICDCGVLSAFDYDPETNITYELGFKSTFLDGKLNLLGNVFFSQYDDLQQTAFAIITEQGTEIENPEGRVIPVARDIGTNLTSNIAEAEITGVEIEFDWWAWEGGRVTGWVNYLNAEIVDFERAVDGWFCLERAHLGLTPCPPFSDLQGRTETINDAGNTVPVQPSGNPDQPNEVDRYTSFEGNQLPWSPEWSATLNIEHNWYLEGGLRLSPYFSVSWTDEIFFQNNNFDEGPFHSGREELTTYNFALRLINEEERWTVELYGYNLSDEFVRNWADPGPGFLRASFGSPRTWGIRLSKAF